MLLTNFDFCLAYVSVEGAYSKIPRHNGRFQTWSTDSELGSVTSRGEIWATKTVVSVECTTCFYFSLRILRFLEQHSQDCFTHKSVEETTSRIEPKLTICTPGFVSPPGATIQTPYPKCQRYTSHTLI